MNIIIVDRESPNIQELSRSYSVSFFRKRESLVWRAAILCPILIKVFPIAFSYVYEGETIQCAQEYLGYSVKRTVNIIDVGCGGGEFITYLHDKGFVTVGVEGTLNAIVGIREASYLVITDISQAEAFNTSIKPKSCGLALCLEVGEHIPYNAAINLVGNLITLSDTILFSAAQQGQKGHNHVNCNSLEYWQNIFTGFGYKLSTEKTKEFKDALQPFARYKGLNAYYKNGMVFCNEKGFRPVH